MKQDFQFRMNRVNVNVDWLKVYVTQSEFRILMNVGVSAKNKMIWVLVKMICSKCGHSKCELWNSSKCGHGCKMACKINNYFDIKICLCEKHLFGKLVLASEDEILNTTES